MAQKSYGSRTEVRQYAEDNKVLRLVDDLVDELLKNKPLRPMEHLTRYLASQCGLEVGTPGTTDTAAPSRGVSFRDADLRGELDKLWHGEGVEGDLVAFAAYLKKALPEGAKDVLSPPGPSGGKSPNLTPKSPKEKPSPKKSSGDVSIVQTEDLPTSNKFVESDRSEKTATLIEAARKVQYCEPDYHPRENVFQLASDLCSWHLAGKKLWPKKLTARIERNCRFMNKHHNYGEPLQIVIPLYLYTIHVFRNVVWAYWVQYKNRGRWQQLPLERHLKWEKGYRKGDAAAPEIIEAGDDIIKILKAESVSQRSAADLEENKEEALDNPDSIHYLDGDLEFTPIFHDGKYCQVNAEAARIGSVPSWRGVTLYGNIEPPEPTADPPKPNSSISPHLFIARYEISDEMLGINADIRRSSSAALDDAPEAELYPFADSIAWLPVPSCFVSHRQVECDTEQSKHVESRPRIDAGRPRNSASNLRLVQTPRDLSIRNLPPPGVLEYLSSRRCVENVSLKWERDGAVRASLTSKNVFPVPDADAACIEGMVNELVDRCMGEQNQIVYNPRLHQRLQELLTDQKCVPEDKKLGYCNEKLVTLTDLIANKLGCEPHGDWCKEVKPTPLQIAHALSIQEVTWTWGDETWTLFGSFSGPEPWIMSRAGDKILSSCPLFRIVEEYDYPDQPYYYLNASIRNLQNNNRGGVLSVPIDKNSSEQFVARKPDGIGTGLSVLSDTANHRPMLKNIVARLKEHSVHTTLHSTTDPSRTAKYCYGSGNPEESYFDRVELEEVGWYVEGGDKGLVTGFVQQQNDCWVDCGYWMMNQVRPFLFYIDVAMRDVTKRIHSLELDCALPSVNTYRGMVGARLNAEIYQRGNVIVWSALSSSTRDMSIAQSYASGRGDAAVFMMTGSRPRNISPWSRFGREEEWLYPLNSMFQIKMMLSDEFRQMLGKGNVQMFQIQEVTDVDKEVILIRQCLALTKTKEEANIVFAASDSIWTNTRVLDLALTSEDEGKIPGKWISTRTIGFNPSLQCPVQPSNMGGFVEVESSKIKALTQVICNNSFWLSMCEGKRKLFDAESQDGTEVLGAVAALLDIHLGRAPEFVEVVAEVRDPEEAAVVPKTEAKRASYLTQVRVKAKKPTEKWEVVLDLQQEREREGRAFRDRGAELIMEILARGIELQRIDVRNHGITADGAYRMLEGLRKNSNVVQLTVIDRLTSVGESVPPSVAQLLVRGPGGAEQRAALKNFQALFGTLLQRAVYARVYVTLAAAVAAKLSLDPARANASSNASDSGTAAGPDTRRGTRHQSPAPGRTDVFRHLIAAQRAISIRCLHNNALKFGGRVTHHMLNPFGATWPYDAATALSDVKMVVLDFDELCEHACDRVEEFVYHLIDKVHATVDWFAYGTSKFQPPRYPKLPGILVSAVENSFFSARFLETLLDIGCDPGEADDFGETALLKLRRRLSFGKELGSCTKSLAQKKFDIVEGGRYDRLLERLHVSRASLPPLNPPYGNVEWAVKNFALNMFRMVEGKTGGLIDEILGNLVGASNSKGITRADVLGRIQKKIETLVPMSKMCDFLSTIPVGRMSTTLLLMMLICSSGKDLDRCIFESSNAMAASDTSNRRRESPCTEAGKPPVYLDYNAFMGLAIFKNLFEKGVPEEPQVRRVNQKYDLPQFEYEVVSSYLRKMEVEWKRAVNAKCPSDCEQRFIDGKYYTKAGLEDRMRKDAKQEWEAATPKGEAVQTGRRVFDGRAFHFLDYYKHLWEKAKVETPQPRRRNKGGHYRMKEQWDTQGGTDGDWDTAMEEPHAVSPCFRTSILEPSRNLYNPLVFGGFGQLQNSRAALTEWAKSWLVLNGLLALGEESEQVMFHVKHNATAGDILYHLNLQRGQTYAFPEVSMWREERRKPNSKYVDDASQAQCQKAMTKTEFKAEFREDYKKQWRNAERRWTERGYKGELLYRKDFMELKDDYGNQKKQSDWDCADMDDQFTELCGAAATEECAMIDKIYFSARGKVSCASVRALLNHLDDANTYTGPFDVLLAALETFTVEDVSFRGSTLSVKLISRGSMLRDDLELRASMSRITRKLIAGAETALNVNASMACVSDTDAHASRCEVLNHPIVWKMTEYVNDKGSKGDLYLGVAASQLPADQRNRMAEKYFSCLKRVNGFSWHAIYPTESGKRWFHSSCVEQTAMPYTYRPAFAFLDQLGRKITTPRPKIPSQDLSHVPWIDLDREKIMQRNASDVIEISAAKIEEVHKKYPQLDEVFSKLGIDPPNPRDVYGDNKFELTVGQCQQFIKTTRVVTGESFPGKFFRRFVGTFTSKHEHLRFFKIFRNVGLAQFQSSWKTVYDRALQFAEREQKAAAGRLADAVGVIEGIEAKPKAEWTDQEAKSRKENREKRYRNEVIVAMYDQELAYLRSKDEWEPTLVVPLQEWMQKVLDEPTHFDFTSALHAQLYLRKSLVELSTEACVSQQGQFFLNGVNGSCTLKKAASARPVTFLITPGIDFCFPESTEREAPKYFEKVKGQWAVFKQGQESAFLDRVKILFKCIFTSAKRQGVRHMSMLPIGLGQFVDRLHINLRPHVSALYIRAQLELLSEYDFGFECYWLSVPSNQKLVLFMAQEMLESGLVSNGEFNNPDDGIYLRCNVMLHDKDAKYVADYLASQQETVAFLNPSDSQAIFLGMFGMYWEEGRSFNFVGEEDWAATSTGCLGWYHISGEDAGLKDDTEAPQVSLSENSSFGAHPAPPPSPKPLVGGCRRVSTADVVL